MSTCFLKCTHTQSLLFRITLIMLKLKHGMLTDISEKHVKHYKSCNVLNFLATDKLNVLLKIAAFVFPSFMIKAVIFSACSVANCTVLKLIKSVTLCCLWYYRKNTKNTNNK